MSFKDFAPCQERMKSEGFPVMKTRQSIQVDLDLQDGDSKPEAPLTAIDGFLFESPDKSKVVQFRLDGFGFSLVRSYSTWERLVDKAFHYWNIYTEYARPVSIVRIGTRFINRFPEPLDQPISEVLVVPPRMPIEDGLKLRDSLQQMQIEASDGSRAQFIQAIVTRDETYELTIDIDAYRRLNTAEEIEVPIETDSLLPYLNRLRDLKNDLFFGSVTERSLAPFDYDGPSDRSK